MLVWQLAKELSKKGIEVNGEPVESKHLVEALEAEGKEGVKVQSRLEDDEVELLREVFKESITQDFDVVIKDEPIPSDEKVEAELSRDPNAMRVVKCRDGTTHNLPLSVAVDILKWARAGAHTRLPIAIYEQRDGWTAVRDDAGKRKFKLY